MAALHELAVQRCGCCRGSQTDRESRFPHSLAPPSGSEGTAGPEEGAASGSPLVETDQLAPPKWEIRQVCVKEETPPEVLADDPVSISDAQIIKEEVLEDPAADSGFSVFIKEDPDLDLGVDANDNKEAATSGYTSDITRPAVWRDVREWQILLPAREETELQGSRGGGAHAPFASAPRPPRTPPPATRHTLHEPVRIPAAAGDRRRRCRRRRRDATVPSALHWVRGLHASLSHSTATSTPAGSSVSEVGGTGRAALDSSQSGSGRGRRGGENRTWDETKLAEAATVPTSASGRTATGDGSGGTATGSATGGVDEERLFGDTGSARTVDTKPPICYAKLIAMAIADSPQRRATVTEIYAYIVSHFPYYERNKKAWQKSIRNILSLGKYFVKVPREDGNRKGECCCFWMLNWKYKERFASANFRWKQSTKRPVRRGPKAITTPLAPCEKTVTSLHCARTATPTSTRVSVSDVGNPGKDASDSSHPYGDHSRDFSASDAMTSVSDAATATTSSGIGNCGGRDNYANSGGTTVCSAASGVNEEQRRGGAGSASTANTRPPFCYVMLAAMAIAHSPHRRATQSEICAYIENRFPYFDRKKKVWRSSVRAYLSLGKYFVKVPREDGDHGEHYWTLDPQYVDVFNFGGFRDYPCVKRTFCRRCEKQPFLGPRER
ncbi:uncharacterized protein LOC126212776 [Schistocerca nitens]|uniref:uncharacterized protein LOC126212776 n=1 Tax=Schistocerca nitens TaxID=7011 RepID=UPI0021191D6C|nr:uncharacterized protein LOC126212776 [Schistocerca nitens]